MPGLQEWPVRAEVYRSLPAVRERQVRPQMSGPVLPLREWPMRGEVYCSLLPLRSKHRQVRAEGLPHNLRCCGSMPGLCGWQVRAEMSGSLRAV